MLFAHDEDFLRLASAGVSHAGIVDAHQRASVGEMIRGWMLIYQALDSEDMTGQIEYL